MFAVLTFGLVKIANLFFIKFYLPTCQKQTKLFKLNIVFKVCVVKVCFRIIDRYYHQKICLPAFETVLLADPVFSLSVFVLYYYNGILR